MLICPQCEFENPEEHRYCQSCGTSLTHKVCGECQASIPIEAKTCNFCGAVNHTVLWAIISQRQPTSNLSTTNVHPEPNSRQHQIKIENLTDLFTEGKDKTLLTLKTQSEQLHSSDRYVMEENPHTKQHLQPLVYNLGHAFLQGKVVDRYPLQKSHLATLQKQQMELFAELSQDLSSSYLSVNQYWNLVGVPTHALPYLMLEKYTPIIPQIYDAWQEKDRGIVLLPDRSQWKQLTEFWSQQSMPLLQVIWFLDEMAKLWQPLSQIGCAQSLLVQENLRIDEDQAFCCQQLYLDFPEAPPSLKDLAQIWQLCLTQSNLNCLESLNQLLDQVIAGEISEVEQLRLELHNLGLGEDEIESFDIHSNYSTVNISQPQADNLEPNHNLTATELESSNFFAETEDDIMYSSDNGDQVTAMVPMQLRSVTDASCTDIGSQRDHNEDFFGITSTIQKRENNIENNLSVRSLYIVCDGMGGHAAGEVASAMAVENLQNYFHQQWQQDLPDHQTIERGIHLANETLYQTNIDNSRSGSGRMGTTLVMALLQDTQLAIAHVGDSRIYRITRKQGLERLTLDHEVGQRDINRGVEPDIAYSRPDAYQLTQALGPRENNYVRPDIQLMEVSEDCLLLLCSDGLSDNDLLEENWQQYLKPLLSSDSNLQQGLFELVNFANEHNGHDNITAILVRVKLQPNF